MGPKFRGPKKTKSKRGKLKYKDVVKKPGGDVKHFKPRKKLNLHSINKSKGRRKEFKRDVSPELQEHKRLKVEEKPPDIESSGTEDEEEDALEQLRKTFDNDVTSRRLVAIESKDSSEDDEAEAEEEDSLNDIENNTTEETSTQNEITTEITNDEESEELLDNKEDPFVKHICYSLSSNLVKTLHQQPMPFEKIQLEWPSLGKLLIQIPKTEKEETKQKSVFSIEKEETFAPLGKPPILFDIDKSKVGDLFLKVQIANNIRKANKCLKDNQKESELFTPFQNSVFSVLNNYQDFYYPEQTFSNTEELRFAYCVHVVNHILKTRTKIIHHNSKLANKDEIPEDFRDQGLVRPKVLIIAPFKSSAYKIIQTIIDIVVSEDKGNVINKIRFNNDFTGNEIVMPKKQPKPEDFELTFAGNTSDDFKIGLSITKKSIKLYTDFYTSDIIVASPLGLRYTIGAEGEPDRDFDFLTSIELLITDQTEIFLMQNWDHFLHILRHLHLQPKDTHGTDFSRVRLWSLEGHTKYYRQTVILSSTVLPEINSVFNRWCFNYAGKMKTVNTVEFGSISQVLVQLPHVFQKFDAQSVAQCVDARFDFFIERVLPQQKDPLMKQTLIFMPSYFDFVKIRNYFKKEDVSFVQICEYTKDGKVAKARDLFFHGDKHFLLYTERYHFFNRIRVKGIRHLLFYQLPNFPYFYTEMCNLMQESNMNRKIGSMSNMTVTVLYSKYDIHQLSAVVGTERAAKMCQSDRNVQMMLTGS